MQTTGGNESSEGGDLLKVTHLVCHRGWHNPLPFLGKGPCKQLTEAVGVSKLLGQESRIHTKRGEVGGQRGKGAMAWKQ
jgi:hypothetical protein